MGLCSVNKTVVTSTTVEDVSTYTTGNRVIASAASDVIYSSCTCNIYHTISGRNCRCCKASTTHRYIKLITST